MSGFAFDAIIEMLAAGVSALDFHRNGITAMQFVSLLNTRSLDQGRKIYSHYDRINQLIKELNQIEKKEAEKKVQRDEIDKIESVNTCIVLEIKTGIVLLDEIYIALVEQTLVDGKKDCNLFGCKLFEKDTKRNISDIAAEKVYEKSCGLFNIAPKVLELKAFQSDFKPYGSTNIKHHVYTIKLICTHLDKLDEFFQHNQIFSKNKVNVTGIRIFSANTFTEKNIQSSGDIFFDLSGNKCKINKIALRHIKWFLAKKNINILESIKTEYLKKSTHLFIAKHI